MVTALVGEMFLDDGIWQAVSADDLDSAGYPVYEYDENSGHADILLDQEVIAKIGRDLTWCWAELLTS